MEDGLDSVADLFCVADVSNNRDSSSRDVSNDIRRKKDVVVDMDDIRQEVAQDLIDNLLVMPKPLRGGAQKKGYTLI
jgi:hypothetical protein